MTNACRRAALATFALLSLPTAALAQGDDLCPIGSSPAVVRMSKLIPGGTMAGVQAAIALHQKWYADHGLSDDRILFEPVVTIDRDTHQQMTVPDRFITLHLHAHNVPGDKPDAGWFAYVAAYKKNSELLSTTMTCLP